MPRYSRIPAILRTVKHAQPKDKPAKNAPRLWNAKRRITESQPLTKDQILDFLQNPHSNAWRTQTSPDVVEFVDQNFDKGHRQAIAKILRAPAYYFNRPYNVPLSSRKQVYFPEFKVAMVRKPHDSPFFASFDVPLWFNKLDMRSYLKELYNVDVVHVRSFVQHRALVRRNAPNRRRQGSWKRPQSGKRMKVQLVEPFQYPTEATLAEMEHHLFRSNFWESTKAQEDQGAARSARANLKPDNLYRHTIAKQARDLLSGRDAWNPSWKQIPDSERVLRDVTQPPALPEKKQRQHVVQSRLGAPGSNVVRLRKVKPRQVLPPNTTVAQEVQEVHI